MDMLVVISITAAYLYSVVALGFQMAGRPFGTSEFFETSTLLMTLTLAGRLIATFAGYGAISAVSARSIQPTIAVFVNRGRRDDEIDARLPHYVCAEEGQWSNRYTDRTINGDSAIFVQLERFPGKNTVTDIAQLFDRAANTKPETQDLADKVPSWFVPAVSSIAIAVLVIWIVVTSKVMDYSASKAVLEAIIYFITTLTVACLWLLGSPSLCLNVHLVSGDQRTAVKAVVTAVGIPEHNVAAEYTPSQNRDYVASLMEVSSRYFLFCGHGTNDAVAAAQVTVGIQISGSYAASSDETQAAADAILLNAFEGIPFLIKMSSALLTVWLSTLCGQQSTMFWPSRIHDG
ncbi:unnamed protein product [Clonostachys solani]|uniref:Uncharacterized protein n=1 Tax=Clonostachys solani TaxID=160281 RepID=A0A9N9YU03_9HYPO|nr:unnamed protein product [Clonostachys solani]